MNKENFCLDKKKFFVEDEVLNKRLNNGLDWQICVLVEDIKKALKLIQEDIIEHRNIAQFKHPDSKIIIALSNEILEIIKNRFGSLAEDTNSKQKKEKLK